MDLAGGGAVGWFRAALQDALMARPQERPAAPVGEELARALRGAPAKPEIVAIAALLSAQDVRADPKATYEPGWKFGNWIRQATRAELSAAEFHAVADALLRVQLYDVLREFAAAGRRREPNERFWRFYEIVARTRNDPNRMTLADEADIEEICGSRAIAEDRLGRSRIRRYGPPREHGQWPCGAMKWLIEAQPAEPALARRSSRCCGIEAAAQSQLPGYAKAQDAFMRLTLDERVKLQVLLTAAGYWPAVPDAAFNTRLFNAILKFEVENGFAPLGILTSEQMDRLMAIAGPYLNAWRFQIVRHPMTNSQVWVPIGLPLTEESTATGLTFFNRPLGVALTYDYYPQFTLRLSFESLRNKLERSGATIYYSKLFRNDFFVFSYSDGITDAYVRYHQTGRGGVGFTLTWSHAATDAHIERIATLISGSLWSSESGAPFTNPFTVMTGASEVAAVPGPSPAPQPVPSPPEQAEPHKSSSGTGIFVTNEGHLVTNAHVVKDCLDIRVGMGQGNFEAGKLVAKDPTNDLALLKVNARPARVGELRFGARQGVRLSAESGSGDERQLHHRHRDGARRDRRRQPVLSDFRAGSAGQLGRSAPRRERQSHRRRLLEAGFSRRDQERRRHPAERELRDQGLGRRQLPSGQRHQVPDRRGDAGDEGARPGVFRVSLMSRRSLPAL